VRLLISLGAITVHIYASLAEVDLQNAQRRASPADNWRL